MKFGSWIGGLMLAAVLAVPNGVMAQEGQHQDLLGKALEASARGECPSSIMSPLLAGACSQQMPGMGQRLKSLGAIQSLEFLGVQEVPNGPPVEVYRVTFAKGVMIWTINTDSTGKIYSLWSGG